MFGSFVRWKAGSRTRSPRLWAAITHQPIDFVFCGHLFMAPLAAVIARASRVFRSGSKYTGSTLGSELSALHRRSVEIGDA